MFFSIIATVLSCIASWMLFKKMGRQGWEGIVPFYNNYVLCEVLYGNGWKFLLMMVPVYNIYFIIKLNIDWAHGFHKSTGFAVGMLLLPYIFQLIMALDSKIYFGDGSFANNTPDLLTNAVEKTKDFTASVATPRQQRDDSALEKLCKLSELRDKGVITEEEFNKKKEELLNKI